MNTVDPIDVAGWKEVLNLDRIGVGGESDFDEARDLVDVTGTGWIMNRDPYDNDLLANEAIELSRLDVLSGAWVVVDRIDIRGKPDDTTITDQNCRYRSFGRAVTQFDLGTNLELSVQFDADCDEPFGGVAWQGVYVYLGFTHWAQWARVSRPWVLDLVNGEENQDDLQNPRDVIARVHLSNLTSATRIGLLEGVDKEFLQTREARSNCTVIVE